MLTVDFDRLHIGGGSRVLDLGSGGGRHAYEALRRGATLVALDYDAALLKDVRATVAAMCEAGELGTWPGGAVNANALDLPFPDESFDAVVASEILEHIWDDERAIEELTRILRPGGRLAVTVPTFFPERVSWALSHEYHDQPGGHIRIYRQRTLERRLERAGLLMRGSHHAHALHSPYWWLKCMVGLDNDDHPAVRVYHRLLTWDIMNAPRVTRVTERLLNPVLGKSLVVYTEKAPASMKRRPR